MRNYLKFIPGISLISIANRFVASALYNEVPDHGFGREYKWRRLNDGFNEGYQTEKPIFLLIHKTTCPACLNLKEKFCRSVKLIDLSRHFVMINVENSEASDKRFIPDGSYVPRILFFTSSGEFIPNAYNCHPDADIEHKYFYSSPGHIVEVMQKILEKKIKSDK